MIALLRTVFTVLVIVVLTVVFVAVILLSLLLAIPNGDGSVYDRIPRIWARAILWAAGVKVRLHGVENLGIGGPCIFTSNHVSMFDIPALVGSLPRNNFVAKAELFRIPIFGRGMRALGTVPIERSHQKSAFASYDVAGERIRGGSSVVVFPEGTRGRSYPIRPFKKGPFVLAVKAGVPIVPCVVHGTIEILPKGAFLLRPGSVDVHFLEPVPAAGYTYEGRDVLASVVHGRMEQAMNELYLQPKTP